ncbi:hypothetical protein OUZ56_025981 [Daphnia magna]|uniref:Uncharacterized protein n=1 Tax=Daphnia magna TaxID=35525 RepID=A0ABQ9ZKI6_9CRUS|nr:hypothetical protein OUZ56_025981 [Daphnia magna]
MYKVNVSLQGFVTGRINEVLWLTSFTLTTLTTLSAALGIISIPLPNGHCPRKRCIMQNLIRHVLNLTDLTAKDKQRNNCTMGGNQRSVNQSRRLHGCEVNGL